MKKTLFMMALLGLCACQPETPNAAERGTPAQRIEAGEHSYIGWTGKWTGPEGTYLSIAPQGERRYRIEIADLDGPRVFRGEDREHGIQFTRDGSTYIIRQTSGDETGMKWLTGKTTCLRVQPGEGYCRN